LLVIVGITSIGIKTRWFWTAASVPVTGIVLGATLAPFPSSSSGGNFCFGVSY